VALVFRDNAFKNERLIPELIWSLRVPKRLHVLLLKWKKDKLDIQVLRRMRQTPSGVKMDLILSMTYDSSNSALKDLEEGLGYKKLVQYYNFRRWAANEVNRKRSFLVFYLTNHRHCVL
jgi:hypothetical protein